MSTLPASVLSEIPKPQFLFFSPFPSLLPFLCEAQLMLTGRCALTGLLDHSSSAWGPGGQFFASLYHHVFATFQLQLCLETQ